MAKTFICACCRRRLPANPRIKNQRYCAEVACQRQRKQHWQQIKMATDPDYRANQQDAYRVWRGKNPDYWRRRRGKEVENIPPVSMMRQPEYVAKWTRQPSFRTLFREITSSFLCIEGVAKWTH
jgi:hypothetical protein